MCLEIYKLIWLIFFRTRVSPVNRLRKTKVKLNLLIDTDRLLIVKKGIRDGIFHNVHRHAKVNNKCMKIFDKNKASLHLEYQDANSLYGWVMSQKFSVYGFKWVEKTSQFSIDSKENVMKIAIKDISLKLILNILKNFMNFIVI